MKNIIKLSILTAIFAIALLSCDEITSVTLESISVTEQPLKTTYPVNEPFDPSGLEVTATYSDNSSKIVNEDKLEFDYDFSTAGTNKRVTISYTEKGTTKTTSVRVNVTAAGNKTVTIGAQSTPLLAGTTGSATFSVTTTNIANGVEAFIGWCTDATGTRYLDDDPPGITPLMTTLTNNAATITMEGDATTIAGTYYYRIMIDETLSNVATLTITSGSSKTVTVAAQGPPLTEGSTGSTTFDVSTTNIANGQTAAISWFSSAGGTTAAPAPTGITPSVSAVSNNTATVTMTASTSIVAGTYYFSVTIDGTQSNVVTLTINESGGGNGGGTIPYLTKGAVKYKMYDETGKLMETEQANTYDFSKGLWRMDIWDKGIHNLIGIYDCNANMMHMYNFDEGEWMSLPSSTCMFDDYNHNEDDVIMEKLSNRTIIGKSCETWRITHKSTGTVTISAMWEGIMMYFEAVNPKGMIMEATSATLVFPDSVFNKATIEVTWLN